MKENFDKVAKEMDKTRRQTALVKGKALQVQHEKDTVCIAAVILTALWP